jgi:hypothetical protein
MQRYPVIAVRPERAANMRNWGRKRALFGGIGRRAPYYAGIMNAAGSSGAKVLKLKPARSVFSAARVFGGFGLIAGLGILLALFTPPAYHLASKLHLSMILTGAGLLVASVLALTSVDEAKKPVNSLSMAMGLVTAIAPFTPLTLHMTGPTHLAMLLAGAALLGTSAVALILMRAPKPA